MTISKGALDAFLSRPLQDYTWLKKVSRRDLMHAIWALDVKPYFASPYPPWLHQLACFYIAASRKRFLFLLDMGLGKTRIILDSVQYRKDRKELTKALVTVPSLAGIDSWEEDAGIHSELTLTKVTGSLEEKWDRLHWSSDVSVIDYQGLYLILTKPTLVKRKTKLVIDEKHLAELSRMFNFGAADETQNVKNHTSLPFRILNRASRDWPFFYGMTGTPFGRDPTDVWSQFYLIDHGETFGDTLGLYRSAFFTEGVDYWSGYASYKFDKEKDALFNTMLQNRSITYDDDECMDLPKKISRRISRKFGQEQREHYLKALEGLLGSGGSYQEMDSAYIRMRQITSGYVVWKDDFGEHKHVFDYNPKLDALEKLLDESGFKQIIIFYEYTETGRMITERLEALKVKHTWVWGGAKDSPGEIAKFKRDSSYKVAVINYASGGTVLNLQMAKYEIFYESPASPIDRRQAEKRSAERGGQTDRVHVIDLVIEKSIDLRVLSFIEEGEDLHDRLIRGRARREFEADLKDLRKSS